MFCFIQVTEEMLFQVTEGSCFCSVKKKKRGGKLRIKSGDVLSLVLPDFGVSYTCIILKNGKMGTESTTI